MRDAESGSCRPELQEKVRKVINFADDGSFWLDMDYFSFHQSMEQTFSRKFETLFGEPRKRESDFFTLETGLFPGRFRGRLRRSCRGRQRSFCDGSGSWSLFDHKLGAV